MYIKPMVSYIEYNLPQSFSPFPQGKCIRVEDGTLPKVSVSSWACPYRPGGRSGGAIPGYHPPVSGACTSHSLSPPHVHVHDQPNQQKQFIRGVGFLRQHLSQKTARRGRKWRPLVQKGPLPRQKVSSHASVLVKDKESLEKNRILIVTVAAVLREYVVTVKTFVVSAAPATVMLLPCAATSPKEETQSAA